MIPCRLQTWERLDYQKAMRRQEELVEARARDDIPDQLLMLEHPPVITRTRRTREESLMDPGPVPVVVTNRGGDVTYHGPGQLVAYPVLKLEENRRDLHRYLRDLEQVVIDTCSDFCVQAGRRPGLTGVWVEEEKLASIGVRCSRWVTSHGIALNYGRDLSGFARIIPCGLKGVHVTSLGNLTHEPPSREAVSERFCRHFERIMNREILPCSHPS